MKTYQAYIKSDQHIGNTVKVSEWTSEQKYATRELAQKEIDNNLEMYKRCGVKVYEAKVIEGEQEDTLILEGIIGDNGCAYEDYALTISDEDKGPGWSRLIESLICKNYHGRKARITVELID